MTNTARESRVEPGGRAGARSARTFDPGNMASCPSPVLLSPALLRLVQMANARMGLQRKAADQIAEALGPTPRAALMALVDYGMSDAEIARYHRLPQAAISHLRMLWRIQRGG